MVCNIEFAFGRYDVMRLVFSWYVGTCVVIKLDFANRVVYMVYKSNPNLSFGLADPAGI
jgi:hypothetical protein